MKRKILILAFVVLLAGILSGCCLSHDWQEATCTAPKTCTKCQEMEGEALGHSWSPATCQVPETCTACGLTQGEPLADHDWQEATCESPITCSMCGSYRPRTEAHTVPEGKLVRADGWMELKGICLNCGKEVSSELLAKNLPIGIWKIETVETYGEEYEVQQDEMVLEMREDGTYDLRMKTELLTGEWASGGGFGSSENGVVEVWNLSINMTLTESEGVRCYITGEDINVMEIKVASGRVTIYKLRRES